MGHPLVLGGADIIGLYFLKYAAYTLDGGQEVAEHSKKKRLRITDCLNTDNDSCWILRIMQYARSMV